MNIYRSTNQKIITTKEMIEMIFRINVNKTFDLYLSLLCQDLFLLMPLADTGVLQYFLSEKQIASNTPLCTFFCVYFYHFPRV